LIIEAPAQHVLSTVLVVNRLRLGFSLVVHRNAAGVTTGVCEVFICKGVFTDLFGPFVVYFDGVVFCPPVDHDHWFLQGSRTAVIVEIASRIKLVRNAGAVRVEGILGAAKVVVAGSGVVIQA
jgi:hypothetical protein